MFSEQPERAKQLRLLARKIQIPCARAATQLLRQRKKPDQYALELAPAVVG